jgi:hypothetical protein
MLAMMWSEDFHYMHSMIGRILLPLVDLRALLVRLGVTVIAYVYVGCGELVQSDLRAAG